MFTSPTKVSYRDALQPAPQPYQATEQEEGEDEVFAVDADNEN